MLAVAGVFAVLTVRYTLAAYKLWRNSSKEVHNPNAKQTWEAKAGGAIMGMLLISCILVFIWLHSKGY